MPCTAGRRSSPDRPPGGRKLEQGSGTDPGEPTKPLAPEEYRDRRQSLRDERRELQRRDRQSKYEARASVMQEKEARLRARMAAICLKIERLEDRARKHEARHAELMSRSRELPLPLSAQTREKMVGAVQKTKGALQETGSKARVALQRAGEVTKEETTQLGEAVMGAGARARGAVSRTRPEQEAYTTYESTEETQDQTAPPPKPGGEGGGKIAEEMSSRPSQETPRKGEEPKIEELETQTKEP